MTDDKREKAVVTWIMGGRAENDGRTTPPKVTESSGDEAN